MRELERAVNHEIGIVPFKIEDVTLSDEMEYFISSTHWLDASVSPIDSHIPQLVKSITSIPEPSTPPLESPIPKLSDPIKSKLMVMGEMKTLFSKRRNFKRKDILKIVYQFNNDLGEFEEIEEKENTPLFKLLDSDKILLFVDILDKRVWVWKGKNTSTRSKFIFKISQEAPKIRDKFGVAFRIRPVDEANEPKAFKITVGLLKI